MRHLVSWNLTSQLTALHFQRCNCLIVEMRLDIWGGECIYICSQCHISRLTKQAVSLQLQGGGRDHLIWPWICKPPAAPKEMMESIFFSDLNLDWRLFTCYIGTGGGGGGNPPLQCTVGSKKLTNFPVCPSKF